jgi:molecular chaperone DnaK (HSP70)
LKYDENSYRWGFQIKEKEPKHQWFKLGLDPAQERDTSNLAKIYPNTLTLPPVDDLVTDYLNALRIHAGNFLQQKFGAMIPRTVQWVYIITIPAMWSDMAKAKTRSCAEKAGMGSGDNLHTIAEPEAAALYELGRLVPMGLEVDDTFVLCDAGGG